MTRKEELNNEETGNTVMENDQRMAMYSRALGMMGAQYSGPGFGISGLVEKKEEEDKKESKGSKPDYLDFDKDGDKKEAMKKALKEKGDKEEVEEDVEYVNEDSRRTSNKQQSARVRSNIKSFGSDYTPPRNFDPSANRGKGEVLTHKQVEKQRRKALRSEDVILTKEMVVEYLVKEGYASNEVSAEILHTHVSDGFLAQIEEKMISE